MAKLKDILVSNRKDLAESIDGLKKAINLEKRGYDFYLEATARIKDPSAKAMLIHLAKEELHHLSILEKEFNSLIEKGKWIPHPKNIIFEVEDLPLGHHPFYGKAITSASADDVEIIDLGIRKEEASVKFYQTEKERAQEKNAREVYHFLIEMEKIHVTQLFELRKSRTEKGEGPAFKVI